MSSRRPLALVADFLDLGFGQVLDAYEMVMGTAHPDQFVELRLNRRAIAVLGVLDEEHHQEGDDGRAGVDHQLPGVRETEEWSTCRPYDDDQAADGKRQR